VTTPTRKVPDDGTPVVWGRYIATRHAADDGDHIEFVAGPGPNAWPAAPLVSLDAESGELYLFGALLPDPLQLTLPISTTDDIDTLVAAFAKYPEYALSADEADLLARWRAGDRDASFWADVEAAKRSVAPPLFDLAKLPDELGHQPRAAEVISYLASTIGDGDGPALAVLRLANMSPTQHGLPKAEAVAPIYAPGKRGEGFAHEDRQLGKRRYTIQASEGGAVVFPTEALAFMAYAWRLFVDAKCPGVPVVQTSGNAMARALFGRAGRNERAAAVNLARLLADTPVIEEWDDSEKVDGEGNPKTHELHWHHLEQFYRDPDGEWVLVLPSVHAAEVRLEKQRGRLTYISNPKFVELLRSNPYAARWVAFLESNDYPPDGDGFPYTGVYIETLLCIEHWPTNRRRETVAQALADAHRDFPRYRFKSSKRRRQGPHTVLVWDSGEAAVDNLIEGGKSGDGGGVNPGTS